MAAKWKTVVLAASIVGAVVLAVTVVSGVLYEQAERARDRRRFPQIGRSVDIGGRTLNIDCAGAGQPAIILDRGAPWPYSEPKMAFENGGPRPGYSWVAIQRELAKATTTCWYDRAGSGWSEAGPYPRDSASQARDLHALLQAAPVPPPYILVAESSASLDAQVYTSFYPADVAGLVLVNAVHPELFTRIGRGRFLKAPEFVGHSQDLMAEALNRIGFFRLGLSHRAAAPALPAPQGIAGSEWNTILRLTNAPNARTALLQEVGSWKQSTAEAGAAGTLGDRPLTVLCSDSAMLAPQYRGVWMDLQSDLARLSTRGKLTVAGESHGDLVYEAPAAIIEATRQMVRGYSTPH